MNIALYLASIIGANLITSFIQPIQIGPSLISPGTFFIGMTFMLRDWVQQKNGRKIAYLTIIIAMILSFGLSALQGNMLPITIASCVAFIISESADTEVFTRIEKSLAKKVLVSGMVGGFIDSGLFVLIGLSPIGAGFIPWEAIPLAIAGQWLVKSLLQGIGAIGIIKWMEI